MIFTDEYFDEKVDSEIGEIKPNSGVSTKEKTKSIEMTNVEQQMELMRKKATRMKQYREKGVLK